jgi:hypothetical protein
MENDPAKSSIFYTQGISTIQALLDKLSETLHQADHSY